MKTKIKQFRWLILVLLFAATTINYLDRQIIGLLKPTLEKTFSWTEMDFARIVMAFTAAYAAGLLLFGRIIDRIGTRWGYALCVFLWSAAGMLHAAARNVTAFMAARIGLGFGEAGNFPAGMKAIAEWFPRKERGIATGIFNAGTSMGVVAALFITPWILTHGDWRSVFLITGAAGFIWLIFWLWLFEVPGRKKNISAAELALIRENDGPQAVASAEQTDERPIPWLQLFRRPQTWAIIAGKLLIDPIYWFFLFWLPSYFSTTFQLDLTRPSPELMIIYAATAIGSIGGGYFSSWLIKRGWAVLKARKRALLVFAFLEMSIILAQFAGSLWIAVALISFAVAIHQAWATNIFTMASDLFPRSSVSSVVGIAGMAGAVGGILFPILIGYLLDNFKAAGKLEDGYNLLFTICGCTYIIVWLLIHWATKGQSRREGPSSATMKSLP